MLEICRLHFISTTSIVCTVNTTVQSKDKFVLLSNTTTQGRGGGGGGGGGHQDSSLPRAPNTHAPALPLDCVIFYTECQTFGYSDI